MRDIATLYLTHFILETHQKGSLANRADPDQILRSVASDQGLHCLH